MSSCLVKILSLQELRVYDVIHIYIYIIYGVVLRVTITMMNQVRENKKEKHKIYVFFAIYLRPQECSYGYQNISIYINPI